jgi:peptide/nickel transport system permease protein
MNKLIYQIKQNKIATSISIIIIFLYILTLLAGFISPYHPIDDEFREFFYHPPKFFHFIDQDGKFHLRPFVFPIFIVDKSKNIYSEGRPLCISFKEPSLNQDILFPDSITTLKYPPIIIKNSKNKIIGNINELMENEPNSGIFEGCYASSPYDFKNGDIYTIEYRDPNSNKLLYKLRFKAAELSAPNLELDNKMHLIDGNKQPISSYQYKVPIYPISFFAKGFTYRLIFKLNTHLFKPEHDGKIFLFGTDQNGRDIFSRTLYGARISLTIGILGALLSSALGLLFGAIAGYYGGKIDSIIMRSIEVLMSIPTIYLILAIRNTIPADFSILYTNVKIFTAKIFSWKSNLIHNILLFIIAIILITIYVLNFYRSKKLPIKKWILIIAFFIILLELDKIIYLGVLICSRVIPPETFISTKWTYLFIVIIISFIVWASMARLIRGIVLSVKEYDYVYAAKAMGASDFYIIFRHILPETYRYVLIRASLVIPFFILSEIALSYLGLGIQEPEPSWGNMLQYAQNIKVLTSFPWMLIPGIFIFISVLSFNFLGDYLSSTSKTKLNI